MILSASVSGTLARAQISQDQKSAILDNPYDNEVMYSNLVDQHGTTISQLFFSKGKVYFDKNGKLDFGTGNHRLKALPDKYQTMTTHASEGEGVWVIAFWVDEMRFHWELDAVQREFAIMVDAVSPHTSEAMWVDHQGKPKVVTAKQIILREHRIVLEALSNLPYAAARSYITQGASAPAPGPKTDGRSPNSSAATTQTNRVAASCDHKLEVMEDGTVALQDVMVHLKTSPTEGEHETRLRNVTLLNHYKDNLMFLEIRGVAGERTGLVYFDKGQSVCFDGSGNPARGDGKFKIEATRPEGQPVGGWLSATNLAAEGRVANTATFVFAHDNSGETAKKTGERATPKAAVPPKKTP
jgi:hypothetical protein